MLFWNYIDPKHKRLHHGIFAGYERLFLEKAIEIIKIKNITHILISVPPFDYSSIIIE